MAIFTSSVQVDLTNFQNVTTGTTYFPMLGAGAATYNNPIANTSFNAAGATVFSLLGGASGTATELYVYTGAPILQLTEPAGTTIKFTGLSVDMADVDSFLTSSSQLTSLMFLSTVLAGDDTITGSIFDDTLFGGLGADVIDGGLGVDSVSYAGSLTGVVVSLANGFGARGEAEGDALIGVENLIGSDFADTLVGDAGNNVLDGGDGNDVLIGGAGSDTLTGGLGVDTASYATALTSIITDLGMGIGLSGDSAGDVYISIENLTGSALSDTLLGDSGANRLQGLAGDDGLAGNDGNDTLIGDAGTDTLFGNDGNDLLQGGADADTLQGGAGNDRLVGGTGADQMEGGTGNDTFEVDDINDTVVEISGEGTDRVTSFLTSYTLTDNVEVLVLGAGALGGTGNDFANTIKGNALDNVLSGGADVDTLQGLDGADTLIGGAGNDRLYGGDGNDTFVFSGPTDGVDRIADWNDGDAILIDSLAFGIDATGGLDVVSGTSASSLTSDCVFYNTSTGRVYAYDADTDALSAFAMISAKPASLDTTDVSIMV